MIIIFVLRSNPQRQQNTLNRGTPIRKDAVFVDWARCYSPDFHGRKSSLPTPSCLVGAAVGKRVPHHSQEGFADACGLDRTYMGGIERGERNVALRKIGKIAEALGISLAELMHDI
jgi:hypothetical protein